MAPPHRSSVTPPSLNAALLLCRPLAGDVSPPRPLVMHRATLLPLLVPVLVAACVRTNATVLNAAPGAAVRPKLVPTQVRIFRTAAQVVGPYEEVALLNSTSGSGLGENRMLESMRKKAGELGANGIILDAISEPSAGAKIAGAFLGTGAERKGKAVAIYYTAVPAAPADSTKH